MIRRALIFISILAVQGCTVGFFNTVDVYRPLPVPHWEPDQLTIDAIASEYGIVNPDDIRRSFTKLNRPRRYFDINEYSDGSAYLYFKPVGESIELFPDNSYAWLIIANYLALQRQPDAAILANEQVLESAARLSQFSVQDPDHLDELVAIAKINLGILYVLIGKYEGALDVVRSVEFNEDHWGSTPESFGDLAKLWIEAFARTETGDAEGALKLIAEKRDRIETRIVADEKYHSVKYDYPQYFATEKRDAIFCLIVANAEIRLGNIDGGISLLQDAIRIDPKLWDARLALANTYYGIGRIEDARTEYHQLKAMLPSGKLYGQELVSFNLGNIYLDLNMPLRAEAYFAEVLASAMKRHERFEARILEHIPSQIVPAIVDLGSERLVLEAHNNIGIALLAQIGSAEIDRASIADRAIMHFEAASRLDQEIAKTNIARAKWAKGDYDGFLAAILEVTEETENPDLALDTLFEYSTRIRDVAGTFASISAYLDIVEAQKLQGLRRHELEEIGQSATYLLDEKGAANIQYRIGQLIGD